jgi:Alr-MurF fusion protein
LKYSLDHIAHIIGSDSKVSDAPIEHLVLDSRKIYSPAASLFFALKGARRDGHHFIPELFRKGIRYFVTSEPVKSNLYPEAQFIRVKDTLRALQQLAAWHRSQFDMPVIGITGSNGKTIVKEWLYQLLQGQFNIVRSPRSYNSQIGVPLSVWQMDHHHNLAIFEAGISEPGEMRKLEKIIRPTIGILTNIGEAHSEGFRDKKQKLEEKLQLFAHCAVIIGKEDYFTGQKKNIQSFRNKPQLLTWGISSSNYLVIRDTDKKEDHTIITFTSSHSDHKEQLVIPFTDDASIENAMNCCLAAIHLGVRNAVIKENIRHLQPVNMRLEVKKGINHCTIINDSYSADISSLEIALDFLSQQAGGTKKTVVLSDFVQTATEDRKLYAHILAALKKHDVSRLIGIGGKITKELGGLDKADSPVIELYPSTSDFITRFRSSGFREEIILVKGARVFEFEQIVHLLEQKVHQTVLEIDLNAIVHNLKEHQRLLVPSTRIMAMVKAFAYGSGGAEIAGVLQYHKVDYLGVAYADEGVELRKAGINMPIMVLNPEEITFDALVEYQLEPDIYSFEMLRSFDQYLKKEAVDTYPIHLELETGMNRLGFDISSIDELAAYLRKTSSFNVQSVFSHLSASEDPAEDAFTFQQTEKFSAAASRLEQLLGYSFLKHIANSAAVVRHSSLQMDMVRLGIGLYGIDTAGTGKADLRTVATLKSTVAQLKHLKAGESVSYNRRGVVNRDSLIATVRIGYADGFTRKLGHGTGKMMVHGKLAPVIGTVCMDMTMIDVTDIRGVKEGDEVIIFGKQLPIQDIAAWADTIPYEIMTGISQRVKRVYFEE